MPAAAVDPVQSPVRQGIEQSERIDRSQPSGTIQNAFAAGIRPQCPRYLPGLCSSDPEFLHDDAEIIEIFGTMSQYLPFKRDCAIFGDSTPAPNPSQPRQIVDIPRFSMVTRSHRKEQESQYLAKIDSDEGFREIITGQLSIEAASARD